MADILISQLPRTTVADGEDLLIIDSNQNSGTIVTHAIAVKHLIRDIQFEDGTAVAPSITFINDTNTGFYRPGDDTIGFTTAGINRMVIGPTGNVGIGTLTPTEKLTVSNGKISLQNGGNNELVLEARDGGSGVTQKGPLPLVFATDDVKRVAINETGVVLVNTEQVLADVQMHIGGGSLVVNGGDFTGTASGEVVIGYRTTGYKQLLKLNLQGALANTLDEYGTAGQVLTSGGEGAPFTWSDGGTGGGASEPFTNPGPTPPSPEIYGQFWFNSDEDSLYIWDGQHWQEVGSGNMTHSGPNPPADPDEGELWWDSTNNLLYGWDNTTDDWILIGPQDITDGVTPVITIGTTTTGDAGTDAIVTDTGTAPDVELNFTIPRGDAGEDGESATVALGTVATGAEGTDVIITNSGPDEHNAVFNFTIPRGDKGDPGEDGTSVKLLGTVPEYADLANIVDPVGGDLWVVVDDTANGGTGEDYHAYVWDETSGAWEFVGPIQGPAGSAGEAATITVGTTTTGDAGTNASVVNTGTVNDAVLEFTIPRGDTGEAATVTVGTTTTGDAGTDASVTNSGDENAAILDFTIPRGEQGEPGTGIQLQGSFNYVGPPTQSPEVDNPQDGDLWIDSNGDGWAYDGANWNNVGPIQGPTGEAATITVGTTTTGDAGTDALVTNSGDENAAILDFTIPRGEDGTDATIALGTVATGAEGTDVIITNSGPDEHNAVFNFTIPRGDKGDDGEPGTGIQLQGSFNYVGPPTQSPEVDNPQDGDLWIDSNGDGWAYDGANWNNVGPIQGPAGEQGEAATITVGQTTTGDAGTNASVINTGDVNDAVLEFTIPRGEDGTAATVTVGTTTTGDAGTDALVSNSGDETAAVLDFTIPRGEDGTAATVDVHSTETGDPGTDAIVTNEGTTTAAEFKFVIPRGDKGEQGDPQKVYVNDVAPSGAEEGDLWYETDTDTLKIYVDGAWVPVSSGGGVNPSPIEPENPEIGDLWLNTSNGNIYYWDGTDWVEIAKDDYVDLTSDQTIGGNKTFTEHITGSIDLATDCSRSVLAGNGLTGGGVLTSDVTLAVSTGNGLEIVGTDPNEVVAVKAGDDTITVDAEGVKANVSNLFDPANLNAVISFNGRKGVVVPAADDYSINQLSDVDTTTTAEGYVLTQVGTQWVPREISIPGALKLKGSIDATTEQGPADAEVGDFYVNTVTGAFLDDTSWGSLATTPVTEGDLIVKLEAENEWAIIGNFGGTVGGVESVTAQNGVVETGGDPLNPVLEADDTVVRTTGDFELAGDITFNGEVTFNGTVNGDISGNAEGVNVSILAGDGLVGGGLLTEDRTLSVNHDSTLQILNDELGVVLGAGGGLEVDPYGGIGIDPDFIVGIIDDNAVAVNDGNIGFEVGANTGISLTGDLTSTANQAGDTKLTIEVDTTVVRTMGDQTIAGVKTFTAQTLLDGGYIAAVESFVNADFNVTGTTTTNKITAVIFDIDALDELPDEDPYGNP